MNAASRIEGVNKKLGTEVLISHQSYLAISASIRDALGCQPEPEVVEVDGRKETVVHRVVLSPVAVPAVRPENRSL